MLNLSYQEIALMSINQLMHGITIMKNYICNRY